MAANRRTRRLTERPQWGMLVAFMTLRTLPGPLSSLVLVVFHDYERGLSA